MKNTDFVQDEDTFAVVLDRHQEALALGMSPDPSWSASLSQSDRACMDLATECLKRLRRHWGCDSPTSPSAQPSDEKPLTQFGKFRLDQRVGSGGFGIVYKATDLMMNRQVALKIPHPGSLTEQGRARFLREAKTVVRLVHPGIVQVYEANEVGRIGYLASEFCEGPDLAVWLAQRTTPVPLRVAATWIADLAEAIAFVHSQGVLHRDIKPANVLLVPVTEKQNMRKADRDRLCLRPRLTDFGLAKQTLELDITHDSDESAKPLTNVIQPSQSLRTATGALLGTVGYMSPEQAGGAANLGPESDIYTLGVIFYELLTRERAFTGSNNNEILERIREKEPKPLEEQRPEVPGELLRIVARCLAKHPHNRYRQASNLAADLRTWLLRTSPGYTLRLLRRWAIAIGSVVLVLSACAYIASAPTTPPPVSHMQPLASWNSVEEDPKETAREAIRKQLGNREKVILIGEQGYPQVHEWGMNSGTTSLSRDKNFLVESHGGLVELIRGAPLGAFKLSAEVRHVFSSTLFDYAGIYVGHVVGSPGHHYAGFIFNDFIGDQIIPGIAESHSLAYLWLGRQRTRDVETEAYELSTAHFLPSFREKKTTVWRRLAIEVSAQGISPWWEGKKLTLIPWSDYEGMIRVMRNSRDYPPWPTMPLRLAPGSGIGLVVFGGRAEFRNVVLTPE